MSKWETVFTSNPDLHKKSAIKNKNNNLIRNTKSKKYEDLKKEGDEYFIAKETKENSLVFALENKILKSKSAIKKANQIKKDRTAAAERKAKKAKATE